MSGMDISEKRLPLDGQMSLQSGGQNVDLRISTMPGKYGETVVIRVLNKSNVVYGLEKLGFSPGMQSVFEAVIERPHGIILVTGPTGSGKTTTLYAVLNRIKSPLINIITLEDPIEYELLAGRGSQMGITQVQVQPKIGLTFAAGLRAALRQDPDVIMVGEIRDRETAETAMTAAMTGHLVLSSLHTNDAPSAVGRLIDMGIEPYLISTTLAGVLAQRLVRLLCPRCKEEYRPPLRALKNMFPGRADLEKVAFFRPKGCPHCRGTGYDGRQGIFELLTMSDEVKKSIHDGDHLQGIRAVLRAQGLKSLRESGLELVFQGLTTVEEVARVTVD
jgi:type II secretory ATPase GspE/PulE/Tfp pilus assembly ATPase PilB-like protein